MQRSLGVISLILVFVAILGMQSNNIAIENDLAKSFLLCFVCAILPALIVLLGRNDMVEKCIWTLATVVLCSAYLGYNIIFCLLCASTIMAVIKFVSAKTAEAFLQSINGGWPDT